MTKVLVDKSNRPFLRFSCEVIVFPFVPFYEASSFLLTIENLHDKRVAFKIKLPRDASSGYRCFPQKSVLGPEEKIDVDFAMLPERFQSQDEILVVAAEIPDGAENVVFKKLSDETILRMVLPCQMERISPCISESSISESNKSEFLAGDFVTSGCVSSRAPIPDSTGDANIPNGAEQSTLTSADLEALLELNITPTRSQTIEGETQQVANTMGSPSGDALALTEEEVKESDSSVIPSYLVVSDDTLRFPEHSPDKEACRYVTLENVGEKPMAFKLKLKPESAVWYRVAPSNGFIEPGQCQHVDVFLLPGYREISTETILLLAAEVDSVKDPVDFSSLSPTAIYTLGLKCVCNYVAKSAQPTTEMFGDVMVGTETTSPKEVVIRDQKVQDAIQLAQNQICRLAYDNLRLTSIVTKHTSKLTRHYIIEGFLAFIIICTAIQLCLQNDRNFVIGDFIARMLGYREPEMSGFGFRCYNGHCFSWYWDQYKELAKTQL